jgi:hypothetical protein
MHQEIKATVIWLLLAFFLTFAGFWQAKVVVAQDTHSQHRQLPPPVKTKLATRPPPAGFTGDVGADNIARCEKGMTDQEIEWVLEDFRNAGLDIDLLGPNQVHLTRDELTGRQKEFLNRRAVQYRWYHSALIDGLRLSPEQSTHTSRKLSELFDLAKARFDEAFNAPLNGQAPDGEDDWNTIAAQHPVEELITSTSWLNEGVAIMPWNLCSLSPDQEKLTWKSWIDKTLEEKSAIERQPISASDLKSDPLSRVLPYPAGGFREYGDTVLLAPVYFQWANNILPFLNRQKFIPIEEPLWDQPDRILLAQIRALHPAQLKLLLLFQPEMTVEIQQAMEAESR